MSQAIQPATSCVDRMIHHFVGYANVAHPIVAYVVRRLMTRRQPYHVPSPTVAPTPLPRIPRLPTALTLTIDDHEDRVAVRKIRLRLLTKNEDYGTEDLGTHVIVLGKFRRGVYQVVQQPKDSKEPSFIAFVNANGHICDSFGNVEII